jgi:hypothetical protein
MNEAIPTIIAVIIALIGGAAGVAALMRVNADNSKTISEGAVNVVELMQKQIISNGERLDALEGYASRFDDWSDKVLNLLSRTIDALTEPQRTSFREEECDIAASRPQRRSADGRFLRRD